MPIGSGCSDVNSHEQIDYVLAMERWKKTVKDAETEKMEGILPCVVTVYEDRSFSFEIKTPPASYLIKKAANIEKGSSTTPMVKVGTISESQLEEIAKVKMKDLNANDVSSAKKIVEGTAKSMGIEISN